MPIIITDRICTPWRLRKGRRKLNTASTTSNSAKMRKEAPPESAAPHSWNSVPAPQAASDLTFSVTTDTRLLIGWAMSPASFSIASLFFAVSFAKLSNAVESSSL